jgi:hypothetical protein
VSNLWGGVKSTAEARGATAARSDRLIEAWVHSALPGLGGAPECTGGSGALVAGLSYLKASPLRDRCSIVSTMRSIRREGVFHFMASV